MNCLREKIQRSLADGRLYVVGYFGGQIVYVRHYVAPANNSRAAPQQAKR